MTRTRLVLLATSYPSKDRDGLFVHNEIVEVAKAFDEVMVFSLLRVEDSCRFDLPPNATFEGQLLAEKDRSQTIRLLLSLDFITGLVRRFNLSRYLQITLSEWFANKSRTRFRDVIFAGLVGLRIASNRQLRKSVSEPSREVTLYSFWGTGVGLAVPWVHGQRRTIVRLHAGDLYEERKGYLPFRAAIFGSTDLILPVSESGRAYLLNSYPELHLDSKTQVSRLGTKDNGLPFRQAESASIIVSCSSVDGNKRVDSILDALRIAKLPPGTRWVHFGTGPMLDDLIERASSLSGEGIQTEFRGQVSNDLILEFYKKNRVDLFLNVSKSEGVPVSIMEAMSFGIPILATDAGGTGEIVNPKLRSGELLPVDFTDEDLARLIEAMTSAPSGTYDSRTVWERMCNAHINASELAKLLRNWSWPP